MNKHTFDCICSECVSRQRWAIENFNLRADFDGSVHEPEPVDEAALRERLKESRVYDFPSISILSGEAQTRQKEN